MSARREPFKARKPVASESTPQPGETLPSTIESWLLAPIAAPVLHRRVRDF